MNRTNGNISAQVIGAIDARINVCWERKLVAAGCKLMHGDVLNDCGLTTDQITDMYNEARDEILPKITAQIGVIT